MQTDNIRYSNAQNQTITKLEFKKIPLIMYYFSFFYEWHWHSVADFPIAFWYKMKWVLVFLCFMYFVYAILLMLLKSFVWFSIMFSSRRFFPLPFLYHIVCEKIFSDKTLFFSFLSFISLLFFFLLTFHWIKSKQYGHLWFIYIQHFHKSNFQWHTKCFV